MLQLTAPSGGSQRAIGPHPAYAGAGASFIPSIRPPIDAIEIAKTEAFEHAGTSSAPTNTKFAFPPTKVKTEGKAFVSWLFLAENLKKAATFIPIILAIAAAKILPVSSSIFLAFAYNGINTVLAVHYAALLLPGCLLALICYKVLDSTIKNAVKARLNQADQREAMALYFTNIPDGKSVPEETKNKFFALSDGLRTLTWLLGMVGLEPKFEIFSRTEFPHVFDAANADLLNKQTKYLRFVENFFQTIKKDNPLGVLFASPDFKNATGEDKKIRLEKEIDVLLADLDQSNFTVVFNPKHFAPEQAALVAPILIEKFALQIKPDEPKPANGEELAVVFETYQKTVESNEDLNAMAETLLTYLRS